MDFCQLLHTAQKNDKNTDNRPRYYSTKFEPPKKIKKESKDLSSNIKKFLAKKEAEEQKKREEEQKKKEELLALRAQDKKATRRVNVMLKRTKSANQSVIEDAKDNQHTAVTRAGPDQPDEDDYGYVSQEASQYYEKMMEKYSQMPDEPKFNMFKKKVSTNLSSTKDRVKAALEKEREEAMAPHRRKRKKKDQEGQEGDDKKDDEMGDSRGDNSPEYKESSKDYKDKETPKPKPKPKPAPPPMSFTELLKIAEKKQFEPIVIEKKPEEEEKLYTKKQRKEAEKEREWRERREARRLNDSVEKERDWKEKREGKKVNDSDSRSKERDIDKDKDREKSAKSSSFSTSNKSSSKQAINSSSTTGESKILERQLTKPNSSNNDRAVDKEKIPLKQAKPSNSGSSSQRPGGDSFKKPYSVDSRPVKPSGASRNEEFRPSKSKESLSTSSNRPSVANGNVKNSSSSKVSDQKIPMSAKNPSPVPKNGAPSVGSRDLGIKKNEVGVKKGAPPMASGKLSGKPKEFPPRDLLPKGKPKEFPLRDLKPKQFPPPDVRGIKRKQPIVASRGRILDDDSEEEYDSELDDFIDDGPEEEDNYSSYIKEIFGYDKSRYRGMDDDVDNMESSFAQQMKEEVISTKLGIMEDLEDMKQEEEEKRQKALRMKKMKR